MDDSVLSHILITNSTDIYDAKRFYCEMAGTKQRPCLSHKEFITVAYMSLLFIIQIANTIKISSSSLADRAPKQSLLSPFVQQFCNGYINLPSA